MYDNPHTGLVLLIFQMDQMVCLNHWSGTNHHFHDRLQDSLKQDDTQVERLGSDLQVQVKNLVVALREITKRERQQVIERVHEDCSKVREDMSQTLSIQHYLASLLAETDPFLLIWVRHTILIVTAIVLLYKWGSHCH